MERTLRGSAGVAALVAALVAGACGSDGGGGTPPEDDARIQADVTLDGTAAAGVTVRLFAAGGETALDTESTGTSGRAVFGGLAGGGYDVAVEPPSGAAVASGDDDRKSVTVAQGGMATVTFALVSGPVGETREVALTSGLAFSPSTLTISAGTTVVWRNGAAVFHTITPDGHSEWSRATLSQSGETFSHTFNTPGTYRYYCEPHRSSGMTGVITVE